MAIGWRCEGCNIVRAEKWHSTCPGCGGFFNCYRTVASGDGMAEGPPPRGQMVALGDVSAASQERIPCGFAGVDKILGTDPVTGVSGIAAKGGQAVQIYGAPGSGKSSLMLQICIAMARERHDVLYVAGEESLQQIKSRGDRFGKLPLKLTGIEEHDLDAILYAFDDLRPTIVVVDSVQTVSVEEYAHGSLTAMRIAARELYKFTQARGIGLFLITQMNKLGDDFAGPKEIEHIVDTSLFLRHDRNNVRVLECGSKNRFGPTPARQHFEMTNKGLAEIDEPVEQVDPPEQDPPTAPHPSPGPTLVSVP